MAEMRVTGLYIDGGVAEERKVGFHSRNVLCYIATEDPNITLVILSNEGVKEMVYVVLTEREFYHLKIKAEREDLRHISIQNN